MAETEKNPTAMTWEQKFQALKELGETSLIMRKPGDWYVRTEVEVIRVGNDLITDCGNGATPEKAVEDHWHKFVESGATVVIDSTLIDRREYRWNGFMWQVVG